MSLLESLLLCATGDLSLFGLLGVGLLLGGLLARGGKKPASARCDHEREKI